MSSNRVASLGCVLLLAGTLAGCGTSLTAPRAHVQGASAPRLGARAVPGQLIVKFRGQPASDAGVLGHVVQANDALGYQVVTVAPGQSPEQAAAALAADPAVEWAEPNWVIPVPDVLDGRRRSPRRPPGLGFGTNDPRGQLQWHAPKINAERAWSSTRGEGVVVAVVDTGIDAGHPDLRANLVAGGNTLEGSEDPRDDNGHGTHVAGIIAAVANNGVGVAGVAPQARIMPIRALGDMGGSAQSVSAAIQLAADRGAGVINLSLGSPRPSKAIESAIRYALKKNCVVVAAMGNAGDQGNPRQWPASYAGVIAVGALEPSDEATPWSNYGQWQAVSAPGYGIWSAFPTYETSLTRLAKQNPGALPPETKIQQGYSAISGTSQASPIVAGVAALLKARNPELTPAQVRERLMRTARDLGSPGFDPHYGAGMVDAAAAVN